MIQLKVFPLKDYAKANKFISEVDVSQEGVEVKDGHILIWHSIATPLEVVEMWRVAHRLQKAQHDLIEATLHKAYLEAIEIDDKEKHFKALEDVDKAIKNQKELIDLYKSWEILKS